NGNGTTFNANSANPYYVVSAINGNTLTVESKTFTSQTNVTVNLSPVAIDVTNSSYLTATGSETTATQVQFVASDPTNYGLGTITLVNGGSWTSMGYAVGEAICGGPPTAPATH